MLASMLSRKGKEEGVAGRRRAGAGKLGKNNKTTHLRREETAKGKTAGRLEKKKRVVKRANFSRRVL